MKKVFALLLACLLIGSLLSACAQPATDPVNNNEPTQAPDATEPQAPDAAVQATEPPQEAVNEELYERPLTLYIGGDLLTDNPRASPGGLDCQMNRIVGGYCMLRDDQGSGLYLPCLFESWDISDDGLTWTFHLNKEARWHDGEPVTADDVIFSRDYFEQGKAGAFGFRCIHWNTDCVFEFEKIDDYTLNMNLESPAKGSVFGLFSSDYALVMPEHIWKDVPLEEFLTCDAATEMIGFGPYKMVERVAGEYIKLEANEDYFLGAPKIKTIYYRIIPDANVATIALENGELDSSAISLTDYDRLQNSDAIQVVSVKSLNQRYISINTERIDDVRIRKALNYLFDGEMTLQSLYGGHGRVSNGFFPQGVTFFDDEACVKYGYNVDAAKALIEEAGYTMGADGYYAKDGKTLEYELIHTTNAVYTNMALLFQSTAQTGGVKINLTSLESSVAQERWKAFDYDLYTSGFSLQMDNSCYNNLRRYVAETENSKKTDELFSQAAIESDTQKRAELYKEFENILTDDAIWIFGIQSESLQGYDINLDFSEAQLNGGNEFLHWNMLCWKK